MAAISHENADDAILICAHQTFYEMDICSKKINKSQKNGNGKNVHDLGAILE